jgi:arylsulfatase A-like enzyme
MNRSLPYVAAAVILSFWAVAPAHANENSGLRGKPNILLILLDDLGWMDLGCQGNPRVDTPHIDRLALQGMRFTDAYAAAPVCSPTRAAVLTGLSPARLRITNHIPDQKGFIPDGAKVLPAEMLDHLPLERVTVAERLQKAGYATGFFGKWHLAGRAGPEGKGLVEFYPEHQGFTVNVGGCSHAGPPTYFDPYRIHTLPNRRPGEYLPDRMADEVIQFMRSHRDGPFLAFLWDYAVHYPMEAPAGLIRKYESRVGPGVKDPRYAAMTEATDAAIGKILTALDDLGLRDNTLVIFTSDNGPFLGVADAKPLRSGKGYLYEGGIRVPLIVRWPDHVQPGSVCSTPVISMDFYPTILEAAGISQDASEPLDGESLLPLLKQAGDLRRQAIYFHYPNYAFHRSNRLGSAIRRGDYKLIEFFDDASVELYNLRDDEEETQDLSAKRPEITASLRSELVRWREASGAAMPRRADHGGAETPSGDGRD